MTKITTPSLSLKQWLKVSRSFTWKLTVISLLVSILNHVVQLTMTFFINQTTSYDSIDYVIGTILLEPLISGLGYVFSLSWLFGIHIESINILSQLAEIILAISFSPENLLVYTPYYISTVVLYILIGVLGYGMTLNWFFKRPLKEFRFILTTNDSNSSVLDSSSLSLIQWLVLTWSFFWRSTIIFVAAFPVLSSLVILLTYISTMSIALSLILVPLLIVLFFVLAIPLNMVILRWFFRAKFKKHHIMVTKNEDSV